VGVANVVSEILVIGCVPMVGFVVHTYCNALIAGRVKLTVVDPLIATSISSGDVFFNIRNLADVTVPNGIGITVPIVVLV
jgi:hypothetical protein